MPEPSSFSAGHRTRRVVGFARARHSADDVVEPIAEAGSEPGIVRTTLTTSVSLTMRGRRLEPLCDSGATVTSSRPALAYRSNSDASHRRQPRCPGVRVSLRECAVPNRNELVDVGLNVIGRDRWTIRPATRSGGSPGRAQRQR